MIKSVEEIVSENKNMIYSIAFKYSNYYNIEDLFQVGAIGIMKAYKNYNMSSNAKFLTYAYKYILGEIIEFIKNDRTMKVSDEYMKLFKAYEKAKDFLTTEKGREPSIFEISNFIDVDPNYLQSIINSCAFTTSLDSPLNEEDFNLEKVTGVDNRDITDDMIDLKNEINKLDDQEKRLIDLRYFKDYTQDETAKILGISQVQVSRFESNILKKIRTKVAA